MVEQLIGLSRGLPSTHRDLGEGGPQTEAWSRARLPPGGGWNGEPGQGEGAVPDLQPPTPGEVRGILHLPRHLVEGIPHF